MINTFSLKELFPSKLSAILQTEASECGLACVAMIANYYGHIMDISAMRCRYSVSVNGMTVRALMEAADRVGLLSRPLKLGLEHIKQLRTPCILHWDFNHFVVLDRVSKHGAVILDPAIGRRTVSHTQLSDHFTGIAIELWPTSSFEKKTDYRRVYLTSLLRGIQGVKSTIFSILFLTACIEFFLVITPICIQLIFDQVIVSRDSNLLILITFGLSILLILRSLTELTRMWLIINIGAKLNLQWSTSLKSHLINLPISFFERRHLGDIYGRFSSLQEIQDAFTSDLIIALFDGVMLISLLSLMAYYNLTLTFIVIIGSCIYISIRLLLLNIYRNSTEELIVNRAKEDSYFMETIRGIVSIKMFNMQSKRCKQWSNLFIDMLNSKLKTQLIDLSLNIFRIIIIGIQGIIILYIGSVEIINNSMTAGMLIAVLAYRDQFDMRIEKLLSIVFKFKLINFHGERVADIALAPVEQLKRRLPYAILKHEGTGIRLRADNIQFRYGDGEREILANININISQGESIAIVGPSGSGKTTLIKILSGLLTPTGGRILIDGVDLQEFGLEHYRNISASVLQDDRLFTGSIAENIAAFEPELDQTWVEECARYAALHEDIMCMPMKYESRIGDMGSSLSGGQKQRLYIARALYKKPKILFLDEATSHLDSDNEIAINNIISTFEITRIIVAHRPSTIKSAKRIYHLASAQEL